MIIINIIMLLLFSGITFSFIWTQRSKRKIIAHLKEEVKELKSCQGFVLDAREWQDKIDCLKYEYKDRCKDEQVLEDMIAKESKTLAQIQESVKLLSDEYNFQISNLENQYSVALKGLEAKNNLAKEQIKQENKKFLTAQSDSLLKDMADITEYFEDKIQTCISEYQKYQNAFKEAKRNTDLVLEAALAQEKERNALDFSRIQLPPQDIKEIHKLHEIAEELRNAEPLNKVIWKVYYQTPTGEMIKRVLGTDIKCGIYKITHIDSGKSYIGQSVDVATRWKQHIKRGLGADPITRNKLYPAMNELGPENFTFTLLEECPKEELSKREKFWIDYYQSYDFGYNDTTGG